MKKTSTWRFVMKIVGASLALAGGICLVIGYWDKLMSGGCAVKKAVEAKCKYRYSEFDDYDDELLYEE